MAGNNASFIPKSSSRPNRKVRTTRRIYVLSYLSYVVFFGTLLGTLAVFFYSVQVSRALEQANTNLEIQQNQFAQSEIDSLKALEKQLLVAEHFINTATAPSRLFSEIESVVASNIYLTGFRYELLVNDQYRVDITGRADTFNKILYQNDLFNRSEVLRDAQIKNFDYALSESELELEIDDEIEESPLTLLAAIGSEDPIISFTFTAENPISTIAYVPQAPATPPGTEFLTARGTSIEDEGGAEVEENADEESSEGQSVIDVDAETEVLEDTSDSDQ